ncbi:MAG TPA: hypothetical protein VJ725_10895 [Thermoanaerobaculia bacterium]|nr:hypothetical protein [Thermoanaerobaculia bacterium]
MMPFGKIPCLLLLILGSALPARAALSNAPHEDVHFLAEHLPESGMDARFLSLPGPGEPLAAGRWQTVVEAGYAATSAGFFDLEGPLVAAAGIYGLSERWGIEGLAFYDALKVSGGEGREVLRAPFAPGVPLDLPEYARFSNPRGDYLHWGIGAAAVRELSPAGSAKRWTLMAGLLWDRLEMDGFAADYRIEGGESAGVSGVLDHSLTADFWTPFVGLQQTRPWGPRFALVPRAVAGAPLPPRDFPGRITGPGFDRSSEDPGGNPGKIGDAFVGLGLGLRDRRTGLEVDLGGTLYFWGFEKLTHPGVDRALLIQLSWRGW